MTVHADDGVGRDLSAKRGRAETVRHESTDVASLDAEMVELEHCAIVLSAVRARMSAEMLLDDPARDDAPATPCGRCLT